MPLRLVNEVIGAGLSRFSQSQPVSNCPSCETRGALDYSARRGSLYPTK
jgi:hypothetical protein